MVKRHRELDLLVSLQRINVERDRKLERWGRARAMKMPYLEQCGPMLQKLQSETEADAKKFVEVDLAAARTFKDTTFANVRATVSDYRGQLTDFNAMVTDLDKVATSNGGPTSGDSSPSPVQAAPQTNGAGGAPQPSPLSPPA